MIEHKVVNLRMDLGEKDPTEAHLDALSIEGWQVVACARSNLYLTVIMTRIARVQQFAVDDPKGAFQRIFEQAKKRLP